MLKRLCCILLTGLLMAWSHTALAGIVGGELSKTEAFRQYISTQTNLNKEISNINTTIEDNKLILSNKKSDTSLHIASMYINFSGLFIL